MNLNKIDERKFHNFREAENEMSPLIQSILQLVVTRKPS